MAMGSLAEFREAQLLSRRDCKLTITVTSPVCNRSPNCSKGSKNKVMAGTFSWPAHPDQQDTATLEDLEPEHYVRIASFLERSYDKAALRLSCKLWKKAMDAAHTYVPFIACEFRSADHGDEL
jgi:hypothetical protein